MCVSSPCVCVCAEQDMSPDLMPDESTMWGARYNSLNSLAACPNNTTDFAMLAQFVSTPFTHKTPFGSSCFQDKGTGRLSVTWTLSAQQRLHIRRNVSILFHLQRTTVMAVTLTMTLSSGVSPRNSGNRSAPACFQPTRTLNLILFINCLYSDLHHFS